MTIAHINNQYEEKVSVSDIPMQAASLDIWDKKYRLKSKDGVVVDATIDDTYQRVARNLAGVENDPQKKACWYERFLWALRHGAIPAGRIISNAGALDHKPATSTINCTVSGTIQDSMNGILGKVYEAGLTLKAGCGIGYEFSRCRRVYLWSVVFHGYLRQDVFHHLLGGRPARGADGDLRCWTPGCARIHPRQA
jgi:ribonucleotide reductase alpha subunit